MIIRVIGLSGKARKTFAFKNSMETKKGGENATLSVVR